MLIHIFRNKIHIWDFNFRKFICYWVHYYTPTKKTKNKNKNKKQKQKQNKN